MDFTQVFIFPILSRALPNKLPAHITFVSWALIHHGKGFLITHFYLSALPVILNIHVLLQKESFIHKRLHLGMTCYHRRILRFISNSRDMLILR